MGAGGSATSCTFEEGTDYEGDDVANIEVDNKEDCCQACINQPGCTVSVLFEGKCFLKSSTPDSKKDSEGRTACVLDGAGGDVGPPSGDGGAEDDAPAADADVEPEEAPTPEPTPSPMPPTPRPVPGKEAPHHVDEEDLGLFNCDDDDSTWGKKQKDFCCNNEGKGCTATGSSLQGASAALRSPVVKDGSRRFRVAGEFASWAVGAAFAAAALLSVGCYYRRGPRLEQRIPPHLRWLAGRRQVSGFTDTFERSADGYTELCPATPSALTPPSTGCL